MGSAQNDDQSRLRIGLVVLLVGVVILLAAVGMAIIRDQEPGVEIAARPEGALGPDGDAQRPARVGVAMPVFFTLAGVLAIVLLFVAIALFKITRKLAIPQAPEPKPKPTPSDDVWKMHRLPADESDRTG